MWKELTAYVRVFIKRHIVTQDHDSCDLCRVSPTFGKNIEGFAVSFETRLDHQKRSVTAMLDYDSAMLPQRGLLDISYPNYAQAISTWPVEAFGKLGVKHVHGFTGGSLNGTGWLVNSINHSNGERKSFRTAFLDRPRDALTSSS